MAKQLLHGWKGQRRAIHSVSSRISAWPAGGLGRFWRQSRSLRLLSDPDVPVAIRWQARSWPIPLVKPALDEGDGPAREGLRMPDASDCKASRRFLIVSMVREELSCNCKEALNNWREALAMPHESGLDGDGAAIVRERAIDNSLRTQGHR